MGNKLDKQYIELLDDILKNNVESKEEKQKKLKKLIPMKTESFHRSLLEDNSLITHLDPIDFFHEQS